MPVPAPLDAYVTLLDRYGTMRFAQVAAPALRILDRHEKDWHAKLARTIRRLIEAEKKAKDRSRGLRLVSDYFYRGPIAREIDAWSRANGGLMRYTDLAGHVTRVEEPVTATYRGYTICKCNTWTQGPYLLQTLRLLEGFDLKSMGYQSADSIHLRIEALKLALADRDVYYGDQNFVDVPMKELLSDKYNRMRHAITPSGWGPMAGDTGIWTSGRMVSLNVWEGHPNCIRPGKRPRMTLTPTIVLKNGKPVMAVSVAGGDTQDQGSLQIITNYIDFRRPASELVSTPRYCTDHLVGSFSQPPPKLGSLTMGTKTDSKVVEDLKSRGHRIELDDFWQMRTVIVIDPETGLLHGAGDPEAPIPRHAAAF
jgi:gamma-glutamyltranspeptidase/glutathione hydrolase